MSDGTPSCTGLTAAWCPVCGDCTCALLPSGEPCLDSEHCPLHSVHSKHAETQTLEDCRARVEVLADNCGVTLTKDDSETVARFAQWLHARQRDQAQGKNGAN